METIFKNFSPNPKNCQKVRQTKSGNHEPIEFRWNLSNLLFGKKSRGSGLNVAMPYPKKTLGIVGLTPGQAQEK
jgi:hypothetical protein